MFSPLKYKIPILVTAVILLIAAISQLPKLKGDYSFEDFFPMNDEGLEFYYDFRAKFPSNDDVVMIGLKNEVGVFDTTFLSKLDSLTTELKTITKVENVLSLTNLKKPVKTPFGITQKKVVPLGAKSYERIKSQLLKDKRIVNSLLSEDAKVTALVVEVQPKITETRRDSVINAMVAYSKAHQFDSYHLAGEIYTQTSYIQMIEKENYKMVPLVMLAVIFILTLLYRSFWSVAIPAVSVLIGMTYLFGYAAFIGRGINMATLMFPTIMVVVGLSDLIHLYSKFQIELKLGKRKAEAMNTALVEMRSTLLLTSVTTMIGFLSIGFSDIPHVSTFGKDGAVGVLIAFVVAITITPVVLNYLPSSKTRATAVNWVKVNDWIYKVVNNQKGWILGLTGFFLALAVVGIQKVDTNNYLLGAISDSAKVKQDYLFFEKELAGVRSMEFAILPQKGDILDAAVLGEVAKLEAHLDAIETIGPIVSPLTYLQTANEITTKKYELPKASQIPSLYKKWHKLLRFEYNIVDDLSMGKLAARMQDIGRLEVKKLNRGIQSWIDDNIDSEIVQFKFTGSPLLIDKTNDYMVNQTLQGLLAALVLISFLMAYLFRSFKMVLISMIPNVLPLILIAGVMGWLGVELNGSTAIIFTVGFVIAVDDTIHFLSKFKKELFALKDVDKAIYNTLQQTGKSIIITSIILIAGYGMLLTSEFKEAWYHGVLICFTLFWAVLADLFLLPIILKRWMKAT